MQLKRRSVDFGSMGGPFPGYPRKSSPGLDLRLRVLLDLNAPLLQTAAQAREDE